MYDLVIVGGGIAGLCAALEARDGARIVVVDKGEAGAGSSPLAQGGLASAVGPEDSPELHAKDSIVAGAGICDEEVVRDICAQGPAAIDWLVSKGCVFDRDADGELHLAREGGQTVARSVHWRDATGQEIVRALRAGVRGRNVERVNARALKLLVHDGRCVGVYVKGRHLLARATLLATGGAGALWSATTNAPGATGDGIALAMDAGTQVADLEFMQFHPTALAVGTAQRPLLTEALRGHGAVLVDAAGERFVDELAPRHVVAKAILDRGKAFLDCRHLEDLEALFPTVVAAARAHGFDPTAEPLPVEPAAHYFIGGVAADASGRTSLPGLFAAGECASTGMHGANRMAGNSLLETVVVGRRVGARAPEEPKPPRALARRYPDPDTNVYTMQDIRDRKGRDINMRARGYLGALDPDIPHIMWRGAGPIRDGAGLEEALTRLDDALASGYRDLCIAIARAALARAESRGVHIRSDFPDGDPDLAARSFDRRAPRVRH